MNKQMSTITISLTTSFIFDYWVSFQNSTIDHWFQYLFLAVVSVVGVFFLEIAQMVTTTHETYWYLISNWDNPSDVVEGHFPWSAMTIPLIDGLSEYLNIGISRYMLINAQLPSLCKLFMRGNSFFCTHSLQWYSQS